MCFRGRFIVILIGVVMGWHADASELITDVAVETEVPGAILFGSSQVNPNHLTCTYYDLTRARNGNRIPMDEKAMNESLYRFVQSGWSPSGLLRYYRVPRKRYASAVMIPAVEAWAAPGAFWEMDTIGTYSLLLYEGTLVHPEGLTFRFRGAAEDGIMVRVGDRVVFSDKMFAGEKGLAEEFSKVWKNNDDQIGTFYLGNAPASVGDWITLEPGVPVEIRIMAAETGSGIFSAMLLVEVQGVRYPENQQGGPILPVFKMDALSPELMDQICMGLPAEEASLEGGPVFGGGAGPVSNIEAPASLTRMDESVGSGVRIWTGDNGSVLEASVEGVSGNTVVLIDRAGRKLRIPIERLSKADQRYVELAHKQKYTVTFEVERQMRKTQRFSNTSKGTYKKQHEYTFGATVKQLRSSKETYDLVGELFVLTREQNGDAWILQARKEQSFMSPRNAGLSLELSTRPIRMVDEIYVDVSREKGEFSYLFIIKDSEGTVVSHSASEAWLFPNLGRLHQQPVGAFVDRFCNRVRPAGPESTAY